MAYELIDDEWAKLKAVLAKNKMGRPCIDLRRTPPSVSGTAFTDTFAELTNDQMLKCTATA